MNKDDPPPETAAPTPTQKIQSPPCAASAKAADPDAVAAEIETLPRSSSTTSTTVRQLATQTLTARKNCLRDSTRTETTGTNRRATN